MKSIIKKLILTILTIVVLIVGMSIFTDLKDNNGYEYESNIVNKQNGEALQIANAKITNLRERSNRELTASTEIKNISQLNLSQINLYYEELDENENEGTKSKLVLDMTLKPNETMEVEFNHKDYTNTIVITGYTYIVEDSEVHVDLKDSEVTIYENTKYLENSKNYEVLAINKKNNSEDGLSSIINIQNISQKNLGNLVLKIAEVDSNNRFIKINHITFESILKPEQKEDMILSRSKPEYEIIILGYTYDDMESKSNIDIDLISHKVNIIDNKEQK